MNRNRTIAVAKKLRPIDDILFHKMAEDNEFCEELIRTILDQPIEVMETIPQDSIKNLQGRSVILDVMCRTMGGRVFDVEVQRGNKDDHQRRVRYNASCLTVNISDSGIDFKEVPDVCVIYITEFDIFKKGCAVYHVDRVLRESMEVLENGCMEIYVNAISEDGSNTAKLMKLFMNPEAYDDQNFPKTSQRKRQFSETEEGGQIMCKELDDLLRETAKETAKETATELFRNGVAFEIVKVSCKALTEEELRRIQQEAEALCAVR